MPRTERLVILGLDGATWSVLDPMRERGLMNPLGIARPRIAAVDQHAFAGRRDDQRGGTAFGVDKVNIQTAFLCRMSRDQRPGQAEDKGNQPA